MSGKLNVVALILSMSVNSIFAGNLVRNNGFESSDPGNPGKVSEWYYEVTGADGDFSIDGNDKNEGTRSLRISNKNAQGWMRVKQFIKVQPGESYIFSAWVKSNAQIIIRINAYKSEAKTEKEFIAEEKSMLKEWTFHYGFLKEGEWTNIIREFNLPGEASWLQLSLVNIGKGDALFDNIEILEPSRTVPEIVYGDELFGSWLETGEFAGLGNSKAQAKTTASFKVDKEYFYAKITAEDKRTQEELKKRNSESAPGAIFWGDTLELFISAGDNDSGYVHMAVNPCGTASAEQKENLSGFRSSWYDSGKNVSEWHGKFESSAELAAGQWRAFFKIPLEKLGSHAKGDVWRIAFCRSNTWPREYSSWPRLTKSFHEPYNFARLIFGEKKTVQAPLENRQEKNFRNGAQATPQIIVPAQATDSKESRSTLIPLPQKITWGNEKLLLKELIVGSAVNDKQAADLFMSCLNGILPCEVRPETDSEDNFSGRISIEITDRVPDVLNSAEAAEFLKSDEAYSININGKDILISARTLKGIFYAAQTFKQLLHRDGDSCICPSVRICDWPKFKLRGMHFCLSVVSKKELHDLIRILGELKINTVFLENTYVFKYRNNPECISKGYYENYSADDIREIIETAKKYFIDVVPGQTALTHCKWLLKNHPELREGGPGSSNYCPSDERTYNLVFGLMDELIDVYHPNAMLMGHDEAQAGEMGVCEQCRKSLPYELFAKDITRIYNYLYSRNIKTMIFGDQLSTQNGGAPFYNRKALPMLPKEITIVDWHYEENGTFATSKMFMDNGFDVIGMAWDKPLNIYNYSSFLSKLNAAGFSGSVWWGSWDLRQWAAYILCAEYSWSPGIPALDKLQYNPLDEFLKKKNPGHGVFNPGQFYVFDIGPFCNTSFSGTNGNGPFGYGRSFEFDKIPKGLNSFNKIPFRMSGRDGAAKDALVIGSREYGSSLPYPAESPSIGINEKLQGLIFLHCCDKSRKGSEIKSGEKIARLSVVYEDKTRSEKIFSYGKELTDWNDAYHAADAFTGWKGKTRGGVRIMFGYYMWENPFPDKTVKEITITSLNDDIPYMLVGLTGWK